MAKKSSKPSEKPPEESRRFPALIRVSQKVAEDARTVANLQGISMAEYVTNVLDPILKRELIAALKKRMEEGDK